MSDNDHPLALELTSLRSAFENYQHAAHVSALQLQRARSDATDAFRRAKLLETENDILKREVSFLRSHVEPIQASRQTTELSLALRRLSDKLSFTEQSLYQKTSECLQATSASNKFKLELKSMQNNIESNRALLEQFRSKENHLTMRCKAAEEEAKMSMAVINDYASLVRSLQRDLDLAKRPESSTITSPAGTNGSSIAIFDSFQHSRNSLHQLLSEANSETTSLHNELAHLYNELSAARMDLEAEQETSRVEREKLANALLEIERYKADDMAAEKMVSRYMRFSQSSIDTLQKAVSSLRDRHAATLATLSTSSEMLSKALEEERARISQMRDILDELTEDISRETYGRRREVSLRLRSIAREERLLESLKGWIRRAEDQCIKLSSENVLGKALPSSLLSVYTTMVEEARNILNLSNDNESKDSDSEFLSRVLLAEHLCSSLKLELETETEKRLELMKTLANNYVPQLPAPILPREDVRNPAPLSKPLMTTITEVSNHEFDTPNNEPDTPKNDSGTPINESDTPNDDIDIVEPKSIPSAVQNDSTETRCLNPSSATQESSSVVNLPEVPMPQRTSEEQHAINPEGEKIQKGLADCRLALQQLRLLLLDKANLVDSQRSLLLNVVLRLDDYCEDARVDLEIHIADVERIRRGVQTVHNFRSPTKTPTSPSNEDLRQVFDTSVVNDLETFQKKLDDLEHGIIQVKAALYGSESSVLDAISPSKLPSKLPAWHLFPSSSPSSPAATPSFGSVITAPKPRRVYSVAGHASSHEGLSAAKDPYGYLKLRISMPSQHPPWESPLLASPLGVKSNTHQPRATRSASSLYQLGLHSVSRIFEGEKGETLKTPELNESTVLDNDNVHADVE